MMKPKTEKSGKIYNAALVLSSNVYNVEINAFIFRRKSIWLIDLTVWILYAQNFLFDNYFGIPTNIFIFFLRWNICIAAQF